MKNTPFPLKLAVLCLLLMAFTGYSQDPRISYTLNSDWQFYQDKSSDKAEVPENADWQSVELPHTWNAEDAFDDEEGYYRGMGWYKKEFFVGQNQMDRVVNLHFEGANQETWVYVNGQMVGNHKGGYTGFTIPITNALKLGEDNELLVKVTNAYDDAIPTLTADFTFFGGIYRDVYLNSTNQVHFGGSQYDPEGIYITTPKVSEEKASLYVRATLVNQSTKNRKIKLIQQLQNAENKIISEKSQNLTLKPKDSLDLNQELPEIKQPHLWSTEDPYLYRMVNQIVDAKSGELLDEVVSPVGFRYFHFDADKGFILNGKHVKLIGTNRHQDYGGLGTAVPDALQIQDVYHLKEMGGNFLRIAHYPQDPVILETCDKLGVVTTIEIPIVNRITESDAFADNSKFMLREMVLQNYNHPSIVTWVYMNEVLLRPKFNDDKARQKIYFEHIHDLAQELNDILKQLDPYRPTMIPNHGSFSLYTKTGLTEIPDIVGWNLYSGWYGGDISGFERFLEKHHKELNKPVIVTEYGAGADPRLRSFKPERFDFTMEYETYYHAHYLREILKRPFVAGVNVWNLADFASATRGDAMPYVNAKGLMTLDRKPKDAYYLYQAFLLKKPFIAIGAKLWEYGSGIEDKTGANTSTQPVQIFTNLDKATLFHNGKHMGEKSADENHIITWDVPYIKGKNTLEAVGQSGDTLTKDYHTVAFDLIPKELKSKSLPFESLRVSLGSKRYFLDALTHQVWLPSKAYEKGSWGVEGGEAYKMPSTSRQGYGGDQPISGTANDPIFQTQQVGIKQFKLDVPQGTYEVNLHFAELVSEKEKEALAYNLDTSEAKKTDAVQRVFDVYINNELVLDQLNIAQQHGAERAVSYKIKTAVTDENGLTISFRSKQGEPVLNALEVRKVY